MPSSLNLFIRVPKGTNEQDIFNAVSHKDICKVLAIILKKGKIYNNATIIVDYWYSGTRHIREALIRGEPVSIPNASPDAWLAFEHKTKAIKVAPAPMPAPLPVRPTNLDEFGRDISIKNKPSLNANASAFIPIMPTLNNVKAIPIAPALSDCLPPFVTDNRKERSRNCRENNYAAEELIKQYDFYATPEKMQPRTVVVPNAPVKHVPEYDKEPGEVDELTELVQKLDNTFIDAREHDNISEITDCDEYAKGTKKQRFMPVDFDAPKEVFLEVVYTNLSVPKKRVFKYKK